MKKTLAGTLKDLNDVDVVENGSTIKLESLIVGALLSPRQEDTPEQKATDYRLALRVNEGKDAEYSAEELARIKLVVGKSFTPLVIGRVYELIGDDK